MKYLIYWLFERKIIKDNNIFSRCLEKILLCFAFIYKKKKLNLDQALQRTEIQAKSVLIPIHKNKPFVLEIYKFFYYLHSDICKDLPQPEVWKQLAWLHLAEGSRWQSKC